MSEAESESLKTKIGQQVPLSMRYTLRPRVEVDMATLLFPNGVPLENVPLRDLVDDSGYWRR